MTDKRKRRRAAFVGILFTLVLFLGTLLSNPRVTLLISVIRFAGETLESPAYIAYHLDLMELCRDYANGDIELSGKALVDDVKGVKSTLDLKVEGERSFRQKKAVCRADLGVILIRVGEFDFYMDEESLYMVVPMLGELSYAFDTGLNLFPKAPELTSDLTLSWFQENKENILQLTEEISLKEVESELKSEGCKSYEVTIPKGSGAFIWELLGMEMPDHPVTSTVTLTRDFRLRRLSMDLKELIRDSSIQKAVFTLDGTDCGTVILTAELPDRETAVLTARREGSLVNLNLVQLSADYLAANGDTYHSEGYVTFERDDEGADFELHDGKVSRNDQLLSSLYFKGRLSKAELKEDVFRGRDSELEEIPGIKWRDLRDQVEEFFEQVKQEILERMKW